MSGENHSDLRTLHAQQVDVTAQSTAHSSNLGETAPQATPRVLVISARQEELDGLLRSLAAHEPDWELVDATSRKEALRAVDQLELDCVVLNIESLDVQGFGFISALRSSTDWTLIPTVIVSNEDSAQHAIEAIHQGASDFLVANTMRGDRLVRSVIHAIDRHRLTHAAEVRHLENLQRCFDLEKRNELNRKQNMEIAQELITPLASVNEFVSLVMDGVAGPVSDEQANFLAQARGGCERIRSRVQSLVGTTNLDEHMDSDPSSQNLEMLVNEVLETNSADAAQRGVNLSCLAGKELPQALVDASDFKRVVAELVVDALRASPREGTVFVLLESLGSDQPLNVSVVLSRNSALPQRIGDGHTKLAPSKVQVVGNGDFIIESSLQGGLGGSFEVPVYRLAA